MWIPKVKRNMIGQQYGGNDSQCRQKCWELYLREHPSPSWKRVANALNVNGYKEELEVVEKKYLKGR